MIVATMLALVAAACLGALVFVDMMSERLIIAEERAAVAAELDYFSEIGREEGRTGVIRALDQQTRLYPNERFYALHDAAGNVRAGNMRLWPEEVRSAVQWRRVEFGDATGFLSSRLLEGGDLILVGRDDSLLKEFRSDVFGVASVALVAMALVCVLLAFALTSHLVRGVEALSRTAARVSAGDFAARAPNADQRGPLGEIARAQNTMLDRISLLVTGLRTVTDSLAHDLRTPISRVRHWLDQGLAATSTDAKDVAIERATAETDRTLSTFSALVDVVRANGGLSREEMEAVDLDQIARDAHELFEAVASERGQLIELSIEPIRIHGFKPLLMQALCNLLHNASRFAPARGQIGLSLKRADDETVELCVADHGPGIHPDRRVDALQRLTQFDAPAGSGSMGLGLAIVDSCARLHGGRLILEDNNPGLRARLILAANLAPATTDA